MSSRTYVCVNCRWARRAVAAYGLNTKYRCPKCQGSLFELEWRWRIPRKSNDKAWKALGAKVDSDSEIGLIRRRAIGADRVARLDEQITQVEKQRNSPQKSAKLKQLRSMRRRTMESHA